MQTPRFPEGVRRDLRPGAYLTVGGTHLILVRPLLGNQALLQVATDARALSDAQRAFARALAWLLPVSLLLALGVGWTVAGRLLRPVRTLEQAARQVGKAVNCAVPCRVPAPRTNSRVWR
ncbi:hypothetical protein ACFSC4_11750 [Deinococcus malanensis]|uniref:hypothetical protein n=1 Tax=Deinococcus malanensis TaxID=1706855 RepID=UPI003636FC43